MELNYEKFQTVIDDLESRGANVNVVAYINEGRRWDFEREIDYTIKAHFPIGWESRVWEIVAIQ